MNFSEYPDKASKQCNHGSARGSLSLTHLVAPSASCKDSLRIIRVTIICVTVELYADAYEWKSGFARTSEILGGTFGGNFKRVKSVEQTAIVRTDGIDAGTNDIWRAIMVQCAQYYPLCAQSCDKSVVEGSIVGRQRSRRKQRTKTAT